MDALDITVLVSLLITVALLVALIWFLGGLPGRVAKERNHPYTEAIQIGLMGENARRENVARLIDALNKVLG